MTTDKQTVLTAYPDAVVLMNPDNGKYKVFWPMVGGGCTGSESAITWISLSRSWDDQALAWSEAAAEIKRRETVKP